MVGSSKDILEVDVEALRSRCRKFDEKEAIMLATEASLKAKIKSLKDKLESAIEDRSLMVIDLLPHTLKVLLTSDSFSAILADLQKKVMLVGRAQAFEEVAALLCMWMSPDLLTFLLYFTVVYVGHSLFSYVASLMAVISLLSSKISKLIL
ncbi:hypothetical protein Tco_1544533, partial [Tanacetum coccineum]